MLYRILVILLLLGTTSLSVADSMLPTLYIKEEVTTESEKVLLGDIAKIKGKYTEFEKLINDLKSISLDLTLRPLDQKTVTGNSILELIEDAGIPLDAFGYSIPLEVKITRQGKTLTKKEVINAAKLNLKNDEGLDINVKDIEWENDQIIPIGDTKINITVLGSPDRGKLPVKVIARQNNKAVAKFLATAMVDDWRSIPVVRGRLDRGSIINSGDIHIVRSNLAKLPVDIALNSKEITGRRLKKTIQAGDPVRISDVDIPPVIKRGKLVKMIYKNGAFTASATGIAKENGHMDTVIQLVNERSNKIVKGKVINQDEVLVIQ